jgi:hypothetical protein
MAEFRHQIFVTRMPKFMQSVIHSSGQQWEESSSLYFYFACKADCLLRGWKGLFGVVFDSKRCPLGGASSQELELGLTLNTVRILRNPIVQIVDGIFKVECRKS